MSRRREIEARLALYDDLTGILGAMRSFALAELRWVTRREESQRQVVQALSSALNDMTFALTPPVQTKNDAWLLFGSARGFCGSFNEDVLKTWQNAADKSVPAIVIGQRLGDMMPMGSVGHRIDAAEGGLDAATAIDSIVAAVRETQKKLGMNVGLVACLRDDDGVRQERLLPVPSVPGTSPSHPPMTNEPVTRVAAGVAEHYLFHTLLALLLRAIRTENHMRLMQMENALRHLERGSDDLQRQRNRLRQEEIVEEIELMARGRVSA